MSGSILDDLQEFLQKLSKSFSRHHQNFDVDSSMLDFERGEPAPAGATQNLGDTARERGQSKPGQRPRPASCIEGSSSPSLFRLDPLNPAPTAVSQRFVNARINSNKGRQAHPESKNPPVLKWLAEGRLEIRLSDAGCGRQTCG